MRAVDASTVGVDDRVRAFVALFRQMLPVPTVITSGYRDDTTAHARGMALDLAWRTPNLTRYYAAGRPPRYHRSPLTWAWAREAGAAASSVLREEASLHLPYLVLIEFDHFHISIEPAITGRAPGVYIGYYLPCKHPAGCEPGMPELRVELVK